MNAEHDVHFSSDTNDFLFKSLTPANPKILEESPFFAKQNKRNVIASSDEDVFVVKSSEKKVYRKANRKTQKYNSFIHSQAYEAPKKKKRVKRKERKEKENLDEYQEDSFVVFESQDSRSPSLPTIDSKYSKSPQSNKADSDSEDDEVFKLKNCLPLNMTLKDAKERMMNAKDVAKMSKEQSYFESMFGLDEHIKKLTEMVVFPLVHPELFSNLKIIPPRGVLFYGPPGTGKTMMVNTLVNVCAKYLDKQVAFFTRKGGDLLSKWVGEAERQLIELFDIATKLQPSIIFFDEIDGIAPTRSSKNQDHSHTSVVSTLLALMDGLNGRGAQVIVIGATNRLDSLDPALRRPGRFDYELLFELPDYNARLGLLNHSTMGENSCFKVSESYLKRLAASLESCNGAEIKGLCKEAAFVALRRCLPGFYNLDHSSEIDYSSIQVTEKDFETAREGLQMGKGKFIEYLNGFHFEKVLPNVEVLLKDKVNKLTNLIEGKLIGNKVFYKYIYLDSKPNNGQKEIISMAVEKLKGKIVIDVLSPTSIENGTIKFSNDLCKAIQFNQPALLIVPDPTIFDNLAYFLKWNLPITSPKFAVLLGQAVPNLECASYPFEITFTMNERQSFFKASNVDPKHSMKFLKETVDSTLNEMMQRILDYK